RLQRQGQVRCLMVFLFRRREARLQRFPFDPRGGEVRLPPHRGRPYLENSGKGTTLASVPSDMRSSAAAREAASLEGKGPSTTVQTAWPFSSSGSRNPCCREYRERAWLASIHSVAANTCTIGDPAGTRVGIARAASEPSRQAVARRFQVSGVMTGRAGGSTWLGIMTLTGIVAERVVVCRDRANSPIPMTASAIVAAMPIPGLNPRRAGGGEDGIAGAAMGGGIATAGDREGGGATLVSSSSFSGFFCGKGICAPGNARIVAFGSKSSWGEGAEGRGTGVGCGISAGP